jgi:hypothetical protein
MHWLVLILVRSDTCTVTAALDECAYNVCIAVLPLLYAIVVQLEMCLKTHRHATFSLL